MRVRWAQVPLGVILDARGLPKKVSGRFPVFGWQAPGAAPVFGRPCPHAAAVDHRLPVDRWAELLARAAELRNDPDGYAEPPVDPVPRRATGSIGSDGELLYREAREALLADRARLGLALFHPGDWHHGDAEGAAIQAEKGLKQGAFLREQDCADDDSEEEELEALADLWAWATTHRPGRKRP